MDPLERRESRQSQNQDSTERTVGFCEHYHLCPQGPPKSNTRMKAPCSTLTLAVPGPEHGRAGQMVAMEVARVVSLSHASPPDNGIAGVGLWHQAATQ
ncbi:hypothetical protein EYF80_041429 [Liparis tanakae]|uniref:Uncharacterized protein n=1 Tax=Liparis tanakae TaxID=230148 RepID=A0A4Z2G581_9TELE|nr:hypothetical protein EYF80_041429 [Liparis tanakae]